jgi:hypothetical protein
VCVAVQKLEIIVLHGSIAESVPEIISRFFSPFPSHAAALSALGDPDFPICQTQLLSSSAAVVVIAGQADAIGCAKFNHGGQY